MTCEHAAYLRLLLLCGYRDELQRYVDDALAAEDPLSDVVLELALAGADDKKRLSVLNEYLRQAKDSDIDYDKAVFWICSRISEKTVCRRGHADEGYNRSDVSPGAVHGAASGCTVEHDVSNGRFFQRCRGGIYRQNRLPAQV